MHIKQSQQIKEAMIQGAYSNAYRIGSCVSQDINDCHEISLLISLSQLGMSNIGDIDPELMQSDLSYAYKNYFDSLDSTQELEIVINEYVTISVNIQARFKKNFTADDDELRQQYRGSAGISFDSDDPNERAKAQREREHNNQINKQRQILKSRYEAVFTIPFDSLITAIISTKFFDNKHLFTLEFCDLLQTNANNCSEDAKKNALSIIALIKKARNQHYWSIHATQFKAYTSEKIELEKRIQEILSSKIAISQQKIEVATKQKEYAKKERKRYAIFNRTDRKPLSTQLHSARKTIKSENKLLETLQNGVCSDCDPLRERIAEIEAELSKQR